MTFRVDTLLGRARLAGDPYSKADIAAATNRLLKRLAARQTGSAADARKEPAPAPADIEAEPDPDISTAEEDLRTLCETLLGAPRSLADLRCFLTASLPEPTAARVLGCVLQLAGGQDRAQFWWQYAAGAGDQAASYCLYLHHLSLGETYQATWWHTQTPDDARGPDDSYRDDTPTTLRILRALKRGRASRRTDLGPLLLYVSTAVTQVDDDLDLPLPQPDFTDRVADLLPPSPPEGGSCSRHRTRGPIPQRIRGEHAHRPSVTC